MKPLSILLVLVGAGAVLFMSCEGMKLVAPKGSRPLESTSQDGGSGYAPEAGGDAHNALDPSTFDDAVGM